MTSVDDEWVVLRHFDDAMDAEITLNFLRDHDVRVVPAEDLEQLRGSSPSGSLGALGS